MTGEPLAPTRAPRENIIVPRRSYRRKALRLRSAIPRIHSVYVAYIHVRIHAGRLCRYTTGAATARLVFCPLVFWARSGTRGDCKSRALAGPRGRHGHIPRVTARVTAAPRVPTYLRQPFLPFLSLSSIAGPRLVHSRPLRDSLARSLAAAACLLHASV